MKLIFEVAVPDDCPGDGCPVVSITHSVYGSATGRQLAAAKPNQTSVT